MIRVFIMGAVPFVLFGAKVIDETTLTPFSMVCAVAGACWYLNGRLTRIEDAIRTLEAYNLVARQKEEQSKQG